MKNKTQGPQTRPQTAKRKPRDVPGFVTLIQSDCRNFWGSSVMVEAQQSPFSSQDQFTNGDGTVPSKEAKPAQQRRISPRRRQPVALKA